MAMKSKPHLHESRRVDRRLLSVGEDLVFDLPIQKKKESIYRSELLAVKPIVPLLPELIDQCLPSNVSESFPEFVPC